MEELMAQRRGSDQSQITQAIFYSFVLVSCTLMLVPAWANSPSATLGTIVFAEHGHVGSAAASVGATIYRGDKLSTEQNGSIQLRTPGARLLLAGASSASLLQEEIFPAATLTLGTATFSTSDSKAFLLHVATAAIRPATDRPTIGRVTVLNSTEFIVRSMRGSLSIAVDDDVRMIPEGTGYRVVLEPPATADPQGTRGVGSKDYQKRGPVVAGKSRFKWFAIAAVAVVTFLVVDEALESPDRP
jgi:hypothetical protein